MVLNTIHTVLLITAKVLVLKIFVRDSTRVVVFMVNHASLNIGVISAENGDMELSTVEY